MRAMPKIRCDLTQDLESTRDKMPCFHSDPYLISQLQSEVIIKWFMPNTLHIPSTTLTCLLRLWY